MRLHDTTQLMEQVTSWANMARAYQRVMANNGAPGIDGVDAERFYNHLSAHYPTIKRKLEEGTYRPMPVRRRSIPKPDGGTRTLGIPTLTDRMVQQALLQVLTPIVEPTFSERSFGFRPGRSAHQAVERARQDVEAGYSVAVDLDLESFFDTVNHDRLMAKLETYIADKRILKLIRKYLRAGIMHNGVRVRTTVGTPQGGPLSPLLANIVLDELDSELERRGHRFVRYADDCTIYVRTHRAGERVKESITAFIEKKLKLKVNKEKSAVDEARRRTLLGLILYPRKDGTTGIAVAPKSKKKLKQKLKRLTPRQTHLTLDQQIIRLNRYLRGWVGYFHVADASRLVKDTEAMVRRRLRAHIWSQWKKVRTRYRNLRALNIEHRHALAFANTRKGPMRIAGSRIMTRALPNRYFTEAGLLDLCGVYRDLHGF